MPVEATPNTNSPSLARSRCSTAVQRACSSVPRSVSRIGLHAAGVAISTSTLEDRTIAASALSGSGRQIRLADCTDLPD
jgi:hypothetical protein